MPTCDGVPLDLAEPGQLHLDAVCARAEAEDAIHTVGGCDGVVARDPLVVFVTGWLLRGDAALAVGHGALDGAAELRAGQRQRGSTAGRKRKTPNRTYVAAVIIGLLP